MDAGRRAFLLGRPLQRPLQARIGAPCLARQNVDCRSCAESCAADAIAFPLRPGGPALPYIDHAACTGCGDCLAGCPVGAIALSPSPLQREAQP